MADEREYIGYQDNPESFLMADRARAQLVWFSAGWVEYTFASNLPPNADVTAVEFVAELCSGAGSADLTARTVATYWADLGCSGAR